MRKYRKTERQKDRKTERQKDRKTQYVIKENRKIYLISSKKEKQSYKQKMKEMYLHIGRKKIKIQINRKGKDIN